jgi:hypothetical protein
LKKLKKRKKNLKTKSTSKLYAKLIDFRAQAQKMKFKGDL